MVKRCWINSPNDGFHDIAQVLEKRPVVDVVDVHSDLVRPDNGIVVGFGVILGQGNLEFRLVCATMLFEIACVLAESVSGRKKI